MTRMERRRSLLSLNQRVAPTSGWTNPVDPATRPFQILGTVTPDGHDALGRDQRQHRRNGARGCRLRGAAAIGPLGRDRLHPDGSLHAHRRDPGGVGQLHGHAHGWAADGHDHAPEQRPGSFIPASLTWSGGTNPQTFQYLPVLSSGSPHQITLTNTAGLANPSSPISYAVTTSETLAGLAAWQARQLTAVNGCTSFGVYVAGTGTDLAGSEHYDPIRVFQNVRDYRTANALAPTDLSAQISAALTRYRDRCVLAESGRLPFYHLYSAGCFRDYYETANLDSRDATLMLQLGWGYTPANWENTYATFTQSRESTFSLEVALDCERAGMTIGQLADVLAGWQLQAIDQWTTPAPPLAALRPVVHGRAFARSHDHVLGSLQGEHRHDAAARVAGSLAPVQHAGRDAWPRSRARSRPRSTGCGRTPG